MRSVGIDIGTFSIKVAEVDSNGGRLIRYYEHVLNPDPTKDQHLEAVEFIRQQMLPSIGGAASFVVGLPQSNVTHRRVSFPFKERFKIDKSLGFELEDDIPFSSDNAIFESKVVGYDGKSSDLLAMAAPKVAIAKLISECRDAGFEPHLISAEAPALNNMIENWLELPPTRETTLLLPEEAGSVAAEAFLHLGHTHCVLIVRSQERIIDMKTFDTGGLDVARSISTNYSMPLGDAIKQLNSKGFVLISNQGATKDQIAFSDVIKKALQPLAQNLRLAFMDLESHAKIEIKSLFLSGGLARIKNLHPFFTQELDVAVNNFEPNPPGITIGQAAFDTSRGLVALGLAIEGLRRPRNPATNFLRGEFRKENKNLKELWEQWGSVIRFAAAAYVIILSFGIIKDMIAGYTLEQVEEVLTTQGKAMQLKASRIRSEAEKRIREFKESEKQKAFLNSLAQASSALDVLKDISVKAPSREKFRMQVQTLSINESGVRIEGSVPVAVKMDEFRNGLQELAKNRTVGVREAPPAPGDTGQNARKSVTINFALEHFKGSRK